jgi:opacity protein-like surface antigen
MSFGAELKFGANNSDISLILAPKFAKNAQLYGIGAEYNFNNGLRTSIVYTYASGAETYGEKKWSIPTVAGSPATDKVAAGLKLKQSAHIVMLNGYYDFGMLDASGQGFSPYLGAGFGYGDHTYKLTVPADDKKFPTGEFKQGDHKKSKGGFAYAAYAGVNYNISKLTSIGLGYQLANLGNSTLKHKDAFNIKGEASASPAGDRIIEVKAKTTHSIMLNLSTEF